MGLYSPENGDDFLVENSGLVTTCDIRSHIPADCIPNSEVGVRSIAAVTVDVFDTLILRYPRCAGRREYDAATRLGVVDPLTFAVARKSASRALWRARSLAGAGDLRLEEIAKLTLESLRSAADGDAISQFRSAEIETEAHALYPNRPLLKRLQAIRHTGTPVIAISDTPHRADDLWSILEAVIGNTPPLDALHTSADHDATKHDGTLFALVAELEGLALDQSEHFGDNATADGVRAERAGLRANVVPRRRVHHVRRCADAATFQLQNSLRKSVDRRSSTSGDPIGPIVAEAMHRLWLSLRAYEALAERGCRSESAAPNRRERPNQPVALFCARGGLVMQALLERFIDRTEAPLDLPRRELMVSRIVACRAALLADSEAAYDECAREFRNETMGTALRALGGPDACLEPTSSDASFDAESLRKLLASTEGAELRRAMREQTARFEAHLRAQLDGSRRAILVDTGLYGSTLRLLADAFPDIEWNAVLLARSNYKGLNADHFSSMQGLWCERDTYSPLDVRSVVLRYWQWVEDLFEPNLPSVREFNAKGQSTLERAAPDWHCRILNDPKPALGEAIAFIDQLQPDDLASLAGRASTAWRVLRRQLTFPSPATAARFAVQQRSRDFGLDGVVGAMARDRTLGSLKAARWKEGALASQFPRVRWMLQALLEMAYGARWLRALARR